VAKKSDHFYTTVGVHPGLAAHPFTYYSNLGEKEAIN